MFLGGPPNDDVFHPMFYDVLSNGFQTAGRPASWTVVLGRPAGRLADREIAGRDKLAMNILDSKFDHCILLWVLFQDEKTTFGRLVQTKVITRPHIPVLALIPCPPAPPLPPQGVNIQTKC